MNVWISALSFLFFGVEMVLALPVVYLLVLTTAALWHFNRRRPVTPASPTTHFAILIPAHNEERLLPETLASLSAQHYPPAQFTAYVVADNCTDQTAEIARRAGATVFERFNTQQVGKGHALNWLREQIAATGNRVNAYVVVDADTLVAPDFLRAMDLRLQNGERIVQGYYAVRDPASSWGAALRFAALAVLHYLRPLGRVALGGTAGLKGNGMCFRAEVYERFPWSGSLTEDIEMHTALVLTGERVTFAPEAQVQAEMPGTLRDSQTQNERWERGRWEMARASVGPLLRQAFDTRRFAPLDAATEHLIPPTAILAAVLAFCLLAGAGLAWAGHAGVWWGAVALGVGLAIYLLVGLWMVRAPGRVWLALLYAPFYVAWKIPLLVGVVFSRGAQRWVRTQR